MGTFRALWVSPSGSALVGAWGIGPYSQATASRSTSGNSTAFGMQLVTYSGVVHVGVISHGTFTPLRLPQGILSLPGQIIAW